MHFACDPVEALSTIHIAEIATVHMRPRVSNRVLGGESQGVRIAIDGKNRCEWVSRHGIGDFWKLLSACTRINVSEVAYIASKIGK